MERFFMKCPNIEELQFSSASLAGLAQIKNKNDLSKLLITLTGGGTLMTIFLGSSALASTYSVYSTDFSTMSRALASVPAIKRKVIEDIAFSTQMKVTNYKEKVFWKAIYLGCKGN